MNKDQLNSRINSCFDVLSKTSTYCIAVPQVAIVWYPLYLRSFSWEIYTRASLFLAAAKGLVRSPCSALFVFFSLCLLCLFVPKVIALVEATVNQLCTASPVIHMDSTDLQPFGFHVAPSVTHKAAIQADRQTPLLTKLRFTTTKDYTARDI